MAISVRHFERLGQGVLDMFEEFGRVVWGLGATLFWMFRRPFDWGELFRQLRLIGVGSMPVVLSTGAFTGMVLTLQSYVGFAKFRAEAFVGGVVAIAVLREIGPVLAALMVTARAGSAIAAEIGTMRVTEQIDALQAMGTPPVQYLFVPRVLAGVITLPPLVVLSDAIAVWGGRLVAVGLLDANPDEYDRSTFTRLELNDLTSGLIKAAVFGLLLTLISCVQGYFSRGGAEGAGRATTRAVVSSSVAIVVSDFFLSKLFF